MYDSVEDCELHSIDAEVAHGKGRQCRGSKCITRGAMMDILTPMIEKVTKNRVLPPPPYLVYAKNAVIDGAVTLTGAGIPSQTMIETDGEIFSVSCAPYWQAQRGKVGTPGGINNREDVHALMHKYGNFHRILDHLHFSRTSHALLTHFSRISQPCTTPPPT